MKIGVLGTGVVGQTIAGKLVELGHDVMMGARAADNEKVLGFASRTGGRAGTFLDAARHGEIVFNCLRGDVSIDVLTAVSGEPRGQDPDRHLQSAGFLQGSAADPFHFEHGFAGRSHPARSARHQGGQDAQHHERSHHGRSGPRSRAARGLCLRQ